MQKRIRLIIITAGIMLILPGCNPSLMPATYRQKIQDLPTQITGSWTDVRVKSTNAPEILVSGELIAIEPDTMFILSSYNRLEGISTKNINEVILHMYKKNAGTYALITVLLYVPDVIAAVANSMPEFLLLGLPGVLGGMIITVSEGNKTNLLTYPYENSFTELTKFARFPQGMPKEIDKSRLHLVYLK